MNPRGMLARLLGLFRADRARRFDEEIASHADMLAAEHVARGMSEKEALYAARRDLGNLTSLREAYREQNGLPLLENLWHDLRFAVRTLRRNAGFTLASAGTMAIGLGAMTTVICAVSPFLWTPLPYPEPERMVVVRETDPRNGVWPFSEPALLDLQARSRSLEAVAAYRQAQLALTGAGDAETIHAALVTPSFFALFGVRQLTGRVFESGEKSVVIGRALWKRKWRMDAGVVGQTIALDGDSYTIAGVADLPRDLFPGTELLLPLAPQPTESRTAHDLEVVGRFRAGIDARQAQAEIGAIGSSVARENAQTNAGWNMRLIPLSENLIGPRTSGTMWMIFAAVTLLWLLACANVAGLQLARSIARRHEMNTRRALGASRGRLFSQALTESGVLTLLGAVFGVGIAQMACQTIRTFAGSSPRLAAVQMSGQAIALALTFLLLSTLLVTAFPGRSSSLRGGRELARRDRGRDALIVMQVAMASVLLLGAALLLQSFLRLRAVDPGFDPDRVLTVRVTLPGRGYDTARRVAFFRDTASRIGRIPEVESAGATNIAPFGGEGTANRFRLETEANSAQFHAAAWRAVTPGFFSTLGVPLKRGRLFTDADATGSPEVVILSESMARKFWPNQDPLGRRLLWGRSGSPKTIVGIVGDLRDVAVETPPQPTMFRPYAQLSDAPMAMVIRTRADPLSAITDVRREVQSIDRDAAHIRYRRQRVRPGANHHCHRRIGKLRVR